MEKKYIENWVCKHKYILRKTISNYKAVLCTVLELLGAYLTVAEIAQWAWGTEKAYLFIREHFLIFVLIIMVASYMVNRIKIASTYFLAESDIKVNLTVGNLLNSTDAIVIPTNSTFDTIMEDEFISIKSVQGQFQQKFFIENLESLDSLIAKDLEEIDYELLERSKSKNRRYPLGTVSKVTVCNQHFYFVAIADVNKYGKTENTSFQNIQIALEGLWDYMNTKGHVENISMPILGTGRAGIKGAQRNKVIKEMIFSFIASANERKVTEMLSIYIHPLDLEHKDLNLTELDDYLKYMCKFRNIERNGEDEGRCIHLE